MIGGAIYNPVIHQVATLIVAASDSLFPERADLLCTGVNDQLVIQAAIDAVNAVGGGKVFLMEGTFKTSSVIRVTSGVTLEGSGWQTIVESQPGAVSDSTIRVGSVGLTADVTNVAIKNLTADANDVISYAVGVFGYLPDQWVALTAYGLGVYVMPTIGNGTLEFRYEATGGGTTGAGEPAWPLVIGNSVVDGTVTWTCRALPQIKPVGVLIENVQVVDGLDDLMTVNNFATNVTIRGCYFTGTGNPRAGTAGNCLEVQEGADNVLVQGNFFLAVSLDGLRSGFTSSSHYGAPYNLIVRDNFFDGQKKGIGIAVQQSGIVSGNEIKNLTGVAVNDWAIKIYDSDVAVSDNQIKDCAPPYGIYAREFDAAVLYNVQILDNQIDTIGGIGIYAHNLDEGTEILGNTVRDCESEGIYLSSCNYTLVNNVVTNSIQGTEVTQRAEVYLTGCFFISFSGTLSNPDGNAWYGLYLDGCITVAVSGLVCRNYTRGALYLDTTINSTFMSCTFSLVALATYSVVNVTDSSTDNYFSGIRATVDSADAFGFTEAAAADARNEYVGNKVTGLTVPSKEYNLFGTDSNIVYTRRVKTQLIGTGAGWSATVVNGTTNTGAGQNRVTTSVVANSSAKLVTGGGGTPSGFNDASSALSRPTYDKVLIFEFDISRVLSDAEVEAWYQLQHTAALGDLAQKGLGVRVDNLALKGTSRNTVLGVVDLTYVLTTDVGVHVKIVHRPGFRVEWWIDGVLEGVQTTLNRVPAGDDPGTARLNHSIQNGVSGGVDAALRVNIPQFCQVQ